MKKSLLVTASFLIVGTLWVSPLYAMEEDQIKGNKLSTINNRLQRDRYLEQGLYRNAAVFAIKVINEDSDASDNEDATIEDFRFARDIFRRLAIKNPGYYSDATSYADGVTSREGMNENDIIIIRDLYLKQGDYRNAAYYNDLLAENFSSEDKK